jgi:hypothetical protein
MFSASVEGIQHAVKSYLKKTYVDLKVVFLFGWLDQHSAFHSPLLLSSGPLQNALPVVQNSSDFFPITFRIACSIGTSLQHLLSPLPNDFPAVH